MKVAKGGLRIYINETCCDLDVVLTGDFGWHMVEQFEYSAQGSGLLVSRRSAVFWQVVSDEQFNAAFGRLAEPL